MGLAFVVRLLTSSANSMSATAFLWCIRCVRWRVDVLCWWSLDGWYCRTSSQVNTIRSGLTTLKVLAWNTSWLVTGTCWESACGRRTRSIIPTPPRKERMSVTCGMHCLIVTENGELSVQQFSSSDATVIDVVVLMIVIVNDGWLQCRAWSRIHK